MRVLMLSPVVPSPYRGRRPYSFLRTLCPTHQVRVLAMPYQRGGPQDVRQLERALGCSVRLLPQSPFLSALSCVRGLWRRNIPLRALYCSHRHVAETLRQEVDAWAPDIVHIDRLRLTHYYRCATPVPTVVDLPDALAMYHERLLSIPLSWRERLIARHELRTIRRYEREQFPHLDAVLVCSPVDRNYIAGYVPGANYVVIPNAVDPQEFSPRPSDPSDGPPRLVFTGTLSYLPNLDGLTWYLDCIAPLLSRMGISAVPVVAGVSWNERRVRAALRGRAVECLGFVECLAEVLSPRDVYLCPLRVGSGVRYKLLEAMASGMACVSTTLGYEGIDITPGVHLLAADTPEQFAEQIRTALADPDLRARLGRAAREFVLRHHDLGDIGRQLVTLYDSLRCRC